MYVHPITSYMQTQYIIQNELIYSIYQMESYRGKYVQLYIRGPSEINANILGRDNFFFFFFRVQYIFY